METSPENARPAGWIRLTVRVAKRVQKLGKATWARLPSGIQKSLFPLGLAIQKLLTAARPWVRLENRPKTAAQLERRSRDIIRNGRRALEGVRPSPSLPRESDPPPFTKEQLAAFAGVAVTYLGVGAYIFGYYYYRTLYDRLLPGLGIAYPYARVLEATYRQTALLIVALVPALAIAARYVWPGSIEERKRLREASRYAFLASVASHEIRRKLWLHPDKGELLAPTRATLRDLRNDIIKAMPDGYWMLATQLQIFRVRLIWTALFCMAALAAGVHLLISGSGSARIALYQHYIAVQGPWYVVGVIVLQLLLAALATVIAGAVCTLFFAIEAHYFLRPGKLLRRRIVLTLLSFAILLGTAIDLARTQAETNVLFYKYRFPQVALKLRKPVATSDGRQLLALPVTHSQVESNTVIGYSVPVPMSEDYFLLIPMKESGSPTSTARLARARIPLGDVEAVTRNTGPQDRNNPELAPDGADLK